MDLISSCPTALQHWKPTLLKTALTAKTFLNIILVSPVPSYRLAFFILPLSESKLFLFHTGMWQLSSCSIQNPLLQAGDTCFPICHPLSFSIFPLQKFPSLAMARKGTIKGRGYLVHLGDSYCPKKTPNWELQMEMGRVSTGWLSLPASVNSYPQQFLQVSHFSHTNTLLLALCCQCWDGATEGTSSTLNVAISPSKQRATFWPQQKSPQLSKCPFLSILAHGAQKFSSEEHTGFYTSSFLLKMKPPASHAYTLCFCHASIHSPSCSSISFPTSSPSDDPWKPSAVCHGSDNYIPRLHHAACCWPLTPPLF